MSFIKKYWDKTHKQAIQGLLPYLHDLKSEKNIDDESFRDAMNIGIQFIFGTVTNLADKLGSGTATVNRWLDGRGTPTPHTKVKALDLMIREVTELQSPELEILKEFRKAVNQAIKTGKIQPADFTEIFDTASRHLYRNREEAIEKLDITGPTYRNWTQHKNMPHENTRQKVISKISEDLNERLRSLKP